MEEVGMEEQEKKGKKAATEVGRLLVFLPPGGSAHLIREMPGFYILVIWQSPPTHPPSGRGKILSLLFHEGKETNPGRSHPLRFPSSAVLPTHPSPRSPASVHGSSVRGFWR